MQIMKRMMSNLLLEGMSKNRIRASSTPKFNIDSSKAETLGKTLGELQDFRDLAHDESLKTENKLREVMTEKRSIRDRIAEMKAKIEYKKHLLDKTRAQNNAAGRTTQGMIEIESETSMKSQATSRALINDTKNQLDEAYKLRDKLLSVDTGGNTINPQVKLRIEERMTDLENKIDGDIENNHRVAVNREENLGHAQRNVDHHNVRIEETKYTLGEIKKESEEIDKDIEREISAKNSEIGNDAAALKQILREKQDLKYKIGSLESEVNTLEYQKSKVDVEYQVRGLKDNKFDLADKINRRIEDAKYHEEHIRSLCHHAKDINIDIGFIETLDIEGDRSYRLRQIQDDLNFKKRNEEQTKEEIRQLNDKLRAIGEVNLETKSFHHEEEYTTIMGDLNIGYSDIVQSVKDHISANTAILRKEKEIKEMEARIALIDLDALEEEYNRIRILYDTDSEILRDLEERYSLIHDRLIRLRARLRELNDLIRSLEERLETARFEMEDAERKYRLIKVPKKIEYIINERVEDVLIKKKYLTTTETISESRMKQERKTRSSKKIVGTSYYIPTPEELEQIIPLGSKVKIVKDGKDGNYRFGSKRFFFIKGNDEEYYVDHEGDRMTLDDFITLYEAQERHHAGRQSSKYVEHGNIESEEGDAEVGDEEVNRGYKKTHKFARR